MRVTHVITRLIAGGAQENTISSVLGLRRKPGVQVRLLAGPAEPGQGSLEPLVKTVPGLLVQVPSLVRPVSPWQDMLAYRALLRDFREDQPDLVHTHSGKAGVLGRLAAARAGVRVIVHTIHGPSFGPFQGALANTAFRAAERRAGRVTDHFVVVAHAMTRQYLAAGIGQAQHYTCVRSGFNLKPYEAATNDPELRRELGLALSDIVVGVVGRLFPLKGHDDLLRMAPQLIEAVPHLRFLLVGEGPLRPQLETQITALGLRGKVLLAGAVDAEHMARYFGIMDVLAHLSRREGLPRAVAQALAAGVPVVAYACDGTPEVCRNDETGFTVTVGDLATFAQRLRQLATDPALRQRFGTAGRALIHREFPEQTMVDQLHELYQRLLAAAPGRRS
jgi:glycosyltransferase involved in cell wall biosynthesis